MSNSRQVRGVFVESCQFATDFSVVCIWSRVGDHSREKPHCCPDRPDINLGLCIIWWEWFLRWIMDVFLRRLDIPPLLERHRFCRDNVQRGVFHCRINDGCQ
jgi:hypothetical protein